MNDKVLQAVIKLKDEISKPLKVVNKSLKGVKNDSDSVSKSMKQTKDTFSNLKNEANSTKTIYVVEEKK